MRTPQLNSELQASISEERLSKYLAETRGDLDASICLYEKNMLLSESFYVSLQTLEVCLRNKIDVAMSQTYGADWLMNSHAAPLSDFSRRLVNEAMPNIGSELSHGKLVAEAKFAFWVGLVSKGYDQSLWRAACYKAFLAEGGKKRSMVHGRLNSIRRFRNRIAHHEPIFHKDIERQHSEIIEAIQWMCRGTAAWAKHHSRTLIVLNSS